jgi:hypothetical protein
MKKGPEVRGKIAEVKTPAKAAREKAICNLNPR